MHLRITALIGLLIAAFMGVGAHAQIGLQEFNWSADSRFNMKIVQGSQLVSLRGELRDNAQTQVKKDLLTIDLKHYNAGFLVAAISTEAEEFAYVFLIEGYSSPFTIMNSRAIRARKLNVMNELTGVVDGFKKVSGFDVAQSMRKMNEYFTLNPNRKINDLYDSLEKEEAFVKVLAKPRAANVADGNARPLPVPAQLPVPSGRTNNQPLDIHPSDRPEVPAAPTGPPPGVDEGRQDRRIRRQREIQPRPPQPQQYDMWGRPMYAPPGNGYYPSNRPPPRPYGSNPFY